MTECVWHAYHQYLDQFHGIWPSYASYKWWFRFKRFTHSKEPQFTYGGVVPFIIKFLASLDGFDCKVEHAIIEPAHWRKEAQNIVQRIIMGRTDFGPYGITLEPAIYLVDSSQHAVFSTKTPPGIVTMAIQLEKKVK